MNDSSVFSLIYFKFIIFSKNIERPGNGLSSIKIALESGMQKLDAEFFSIKLVLLYILINGGNRKLKFQSAPEAWKSQQRLPHPQTNRSE